MSQAAIAFAIALAVWVSTAAPLSAGTREETVTATAVWHPDAGFMSRFHQRCSALRGTAFDDCFAAEMAVADASRAALAFTRRLGNEAYLQALDPTGGPVSVAHLYYPFRANQNEAWFLVNGEPPLIDVDDRRNLSLAQMRSAPGYAVILRRWPNVAFWSGDRGPSGPEVAKGGREIIVGYLLRDFCHACAIIGRVRYAFDFAADGKFLGTRLVSVIPAAR